MSKTNAKPAPVAEPPDEPPVAGASSCLGQKLCPFRRLLRCASRWIVRASVAFFVFCGAMVFTPLGDLPQRYLVHTDPLGEADYIIVLGGGAERAVEASHLFREGWADRVITSTSRADLDDLAAFCIALGVDRNAITVDLHANRTAMHPHTIAALPGIDPKVQRFIIVTSLYHTARARAVFAHAGYANLIVRSPRWRSVGDGLSLTHRWYRRANDLSEECYEMLAWGLYKLHGWV